MTRRVVSSPIYIIHHPAFGLGLRSAFAPKSARCICFASLVVGLQRAVG